MKALEQGAKLPAALLASAAARCSPLVESKGSVLLFRMSNYDYRQRWSVSHRHYSCSASLLSVYGPVVTVLASTVKYFHSFHPLDLRLIR